MKQGLRCQRILILSLLCISVFAPVFFFSVKFGRFSPSFDGKEFIDDLPNFKYPSDALELKWIEQEGGEGLKEPARVILKDRDYIDSVIGGNSSTEDVSIKGTRIDNLREGAILHHNVSTSTGAMQGQSHQTPGKEPNGHSRPRPVTDEKISVMKNQLIMAKAYLHFAPPTNNSHLVRELKLRIKEIERVVGQANKDSDLSRSALQRMRAMEGSLSKASKAYPDCSAMATKLRAMAYNSEEQLRAHKNQASHLVQLASRTFPKGLHCLSMRLTTDYFTLQPEERELPNKHRVQQSDLYHYAICSDNVVACSVVVNATISTSMEPEKIVFHVVTDSLNFPAMTMWFLLNPPGPATIQIKNMDDFRWLPSGYSSMLKQPGAQDPRYTSALNHLRFYLPEIFPYLNKILLLDHDVVVQRDLRGLWSVDMKGKVNGAVETCREGETFHRLGMFVDFSEPTVARTFDSSACTWAFGMNMFDLHEWRKHGLTDVYHKWLKVAKRRPSWKAGSLPLGLLTFYNHTVALDRRWHVLGLGHDINVGRVEIERAAVIHYDGNMKPWLEISIPKYRGYWNKFLGYDHPYLQQCNIHE